MAFSTSRTPVQSCLCASCLSRPARPRDLQAGSWSQQLAGFCRSRDSPTRPYFLHCCAVEHCSAATKDSPTWASSTKASLVQTLLQSRPLIGYCTMLFLAHWLTAAIVNAQTGRCRKPVRKETLQGDRHSRQGHAIMCILVLLYSSICYTKCASCPEDTSTQTPVLWTACEPTDSKSPIPARVLSGPSLMDAGSPSRSGCLLCIYFVCRTSSEQAVELI